jgi:phosphopantothenoylcysteine decarboxylase / phosphopantothenate---cysteine ligase
MSNLNNNIKKKNILIIMTGSIACYKVCTLISRLVQSSYDVKIVLTASAEKFIGVSTIEGLSKNKVHTSLFEKNQAMEHIYLDRWADLILVAPASANTINKMSQGLGDDLATTLFLAHDFKKPFLIAPAMNTQMYLHPTTQKSIQYLKSLQIEILEAASGVLACGEVGYGKLLDPELLFIEVEKHLQLSKTNEVVLINKNKNTVKTVLITSGGTQEPIDDVRVISNKSTGNTAAQIADLFIAGGFEVTYLHAKSAVLPNYECQKYSFITYNDLKNKLAELAIKKFDLVIHAAAVSDYTVKPTEGKIDSAAEMLQLTLIKNPKLINQIKKISPESKLIGFKLTSQLNENEILQKIEALFNNAQCDWVVHNEWKNVHTTKHVFNLFSKNSKQENLNLTDLSYELMGLVHSSPEAV